MVDVSVFFVFPFIVALVYLQHLSPQSAKFRLSTISLAAFYGCLINDCIVLGLHLCHL